MLMLMLVHSFKMQRESSLDACNLSARRLWHALSEVLLPVQDVKKAGVGISGDAQKLMRDFGLQCAGLVDLSEEANLRMCSASSDTMPEKWSLASESPHLHTELSVISRPALQVRCGMPASLRPM